MASNRERVETVPVQYLELGPNRRIAYRKHVGQRQPTIMYVPGFFAPMNLRKTVVLEDYAIQNGYSNVRYDQECVGLSTGSQTTIEFEHWLEDALAILDRVCEGPVILVASSLGGWISVLVAQRRPDRIHGIITLGVGFNCLEPGYWSHYYLLPPEARERVDAGEEHVKIKMRYGGIGILRRDFCLNSAKFHIDLNNSVNVSCPFCIIHAIEDKDVPYESSVLLMKKLVTQDVDVILRKTGDHRLNRSTDHILLLSEVDRMIKQYPVNSNKSKL